MTHPPEVFTDFNCPQELPSLEAIKRMERKQQAAIQSLDISADGKSVKCQRCGLDIPIVGKIPKPGGRIAQLERRISRLKRIIQNIMVVLIIVVFVQGSVKSWQCCNKKTLNATSLDAYHCIAQRGLVTNGFVQAAGMYVCTSHRRRRSLITTS
jgi:hypothetical protein